MSDDYVMNCITTINTCCVTLLCVLKSFQHYASIITGFAPLNDLSVH
jgi:hypothetical protein